MSDSARCECCGKLGKRPRFHLAPADWLYFETKDDEDTNDEDAIIVTVCSRECASGLWQVGPGPRFDCNINHLGA